MIPLPTEPLVGDEVLLRLWTPADADWYVQARDDEVFRWTTEPRDLSSGALSDAIARMRRRAAFAGFAIADRASGSCSETSP